MGRKKLNIEDIKPSMTIKINVNLLDKIDDIAKEKNINRSQFIEKILIDHIKDNYE